MTQRIELFVNDSFNWASFMNLFSIRIELLFLSDSKNWTFFQYDSKDFEYFSKIWTLFWIRLKESTLFLIRLKKLKFLVDKNSTLSKELGLKELNLFEHDSMNWTFFNMTRRIFLKKEWLKELKFLEHESKNWIFEFLSKNDSKNWAFLKKYDTKNWTSFQYDWKIFFNMTRRIEPFSITWFKDFFFPPKKNSKNLTFLRLTD